MKKNIQKSNNYISDYADSSFTFSYEADQDNCSINFFKYIPEMTHESDSLSVDSEVIVNPEMFATIKVHKEHAISLARTILKSLNAEG